MLTERMLYCFTLYLERHKQTFIISDYKKLAEQNNVLLTKQHYVVYTRFLFTTHMLSVGEWP